MRRIPALAAVMFALCGAAIATMGVFAAQDSSQKSGEVTPAQFIQNARNVVSLSLVGPVEIEADVKITPAPGKKEKGTYTLDWAAPDRFRREIHLPDFDEISVASGNTLYRKRSTNYTPLEVFRLEELMEPDEVMGRFQQDEERVKPDSTFLTAVPAVQPRNAAATGDLQVGPCLFFSLVSYEELCTEPNGWPWKVSLRSTADEETIEYGDYQSLGAAFVPRVRKYRDGNAVVEEADLKRLASMGSGFPADVFTPSANAEKLDWCYDETSARLLPFKEELEVTPVDFRSPKIVDAFVSSDGRLSRVELLATGAPASDAALRKIAGLMRFSPATCGGKPIASEVPFIIGEADIGMTRLATDDKLPKAGDKGYTRPDCKYCPQPQYSDEGFRRRVQGPVVVSIVVMPDGKADDLFVLKGLGYGLDESVVRQIRDVWQFKPALGPDGKPATVRMMIEIDFHLY